MNAIIPTTFVQNVCREVRAIRRLLTAPAGGSTHVAIQRLRELEVSLAPTDDAAFRTTFMVFDATTGDLVPYNTILGYLSAHVLLQTMVDPIADTIALGWTMVRTARAEGRVIVSVDAPEAIVARYPAITKINAYPVDLLDRYFG